MTALHYDVMAKDVNNIFVDEKINKILPLNSIYEKWVVFIKSQILSRDNILVK